MTQSISFNPFLPQVMENPYPHYRQLRDEAPVYQVEGAGVWVITRYEDNVFALKHPEIFSSSVILDLFAGDYFPFRDVQGPMMMSSDPPEHSRLRRLMAPKFTPGAFLNLRSTIEEFVEEAIQRVKGDAEFDFIEELAMPLPIQTFFTLMGVPRAQFKRCKEFTDTLSSASTVLVSGESGSAEWQAQMKNTMQELAVFLRDIVAQRRAVPADDLVTALVGATDGEQLTEGELLKMLHLLIFAGTESTQKLLGNMVLAFMKHPEQYRALRNDPALIPNAFQEVLRYDGPALHMGRRVMQDVELSGTSLSAGANCLISYGSANHDQRKFSDNAEEFDITRAAQGRIVHMGFGDGVHRCLGSNLASLQGDVLLKKLVEHFSDLSGDTSRAVYDKKNFFIRGLTSLPMSPVCA
jgi:cytochrome P450